MKYSIWVCKEDEYGAIVRVTEPFRVNGSTHLTDMVRMVGAKLPNELPKNISHYYLAVNPVPKSR